MVDRVLVSAHAQDLDVVLVLNKVRDQIWPLSGTSSIALSGRSGSKGKPSAT